MFRRFLANLVARLINILRAWLGWLFGLRIDDFSPGEGWPGTIVIIVGNGFSANRDDNIVTVGGAAALIIVMLGAIFLVHLPHGFDVSKGGMEYALTQLLVALALILAGPGAYSLVLRLPPALRKL